MKPGEEKEVKWTHSHTHGDEVHSHDYDINVKVVAHKKSVTPELTDELAKNTFGYDTVEKLREAVKSEIESDKKNSLPTLKEDRVVEALGKRLQLEEVPGGVQERGLQRDCSGVLEWSSAAGYEP